LSAEVSGNESSRDILLQGAREPGSDLAIVLLADSLQGASVNYILCYQYYCLEIWNWPSRTKIRHDDISKDIDVIFEADAVWYIFISKQYIDTFYISKHHSLILRSLRDNTFA